MNQIISNRNEILLNSSEINDKNYGNGSNCSIKTKKDNKYYIDVQKIK